MPLATSLPTTFTFQPNNQIDDPSNLQQQSLPTSSQLSSSSVNQQQRLSPNDDRTANSNHQTHNTDYETRLRYNIQSDYTIFYFLFFRCPNCETWVVNLSDHLRKTHRIASPVDRKPLLRMARLEKRRMAESANSSTTSSATSILKVQSTPTLIDNGLPTSHTNTNEIENLLFKHEHDPSTLPNQQFSVTFPENILLNQQATNSIAQYSSTTKRQRSIDEQLDHTSNGPLSPNKKSRIGLMDGTKLSESPNSSSNKSNKKNRNKQQQQQPQTIIKTSASGIFPQQQPQPTVTIQNIEESSDDVST